MSRLQEAIDAILAETFVQESMADGWLIAIVGKNGKVQYMDEKTTEFFAKDHVQSTFDIIPGTQDLFALYKKVEGRAARSWIESKSGNKLVWLRVEGYPMHGLRFVRALQETDKEQCYLHSEEIENLAAQ